MQKFFDKLKKQHQAELKRCLDCGMDTMDLIIQEDIPVSIHFLMDDDFDIDIKAVYCGGIDIMKMVSDAAMDEIIKEVTRRQFAFA